MRTDQFSVASRPRVVTGASSGTGQAISERFAADGAPVVGCSQTVTNVEPVAEDSDRAEVDRRMGVSAEIADVGQFLASPAASFLTGETITPVGITDVMETP